MAQMVYPLNDIAVVLMLLSDSCCHLTPRLHVPASVEMAIQTVSFALLILYSAVQDHDSSRPPHVITHGKREESDYVAERAATMRYFEAAHVHLVEGIARERMLVLRTLLPLVHSSSSVEVETVLDALSQYDLSINYPMASDFDSILAQYVKRCISPSDITIWSDECVKEFLLAIALYNSGNSKAAMPVERALCCVPSCSAVAFPCPVLATNALERLVTCIVALVPILGSTGDDLEQLQSIVLDLSHIWRGENREDACKISELLEQYSRGEPDSVSSTAAGDNISTPVGNNSSAHESKHNEFLSSCASHFVQFIQSVADDELSFGPLSVSFEILEPRAVAYVALFVMEKLLQEIEILNISWTPPSTVTASLARLVRSAPGNSQWEVAHVERLHQHDAVIVELISREKQTTFDDYDFANRRRQRLLDIALSNT
ncbi:hypothetical protein FI667_g4162, partial [Globisporangium splendens]